MVVSEQWSIAICLLMILSCVAGCGGPDVSPMPPDSASTPDTTWSVAVFPFTITGESHLSGEEAMNLISIELASVKWLRLVEREALKELLEICGDKDQTRIGKLRGAQFMCLGTVNKKLNLATARVVFTESGENLITKEARGRDDVKNVQELAQKLAREIKPPLPPRPPPPIDLKEVEVKGRGAIFNGDRVTARELALKDAYANAVEEGCGIQVTRKTLVEKYVAVRDKILTESVGYVTSYEVLGENPDSELGYEVNVRATVSKQPLSDLDKLKLVVQYLQAEPRIMVLIDGELEGEKLQKSRADEIAGRIGSQLRKAGFRVDESAAQLGSRLDADLVVRGNLTAKVTERILEIDGRKLNFPSIFARATGVFSIIRPQTAEIVLDFDLGDLSRDSTRGFGITDNEAIENSLNEFIPASAKKLAWELAKKLGDPIRMRLEVRNISQEQAQQLEQQIQQRLPKHIVLEAKLEQWEANTAIYQITTPVGSQELSRKLMEGTDLEELEEPRFGSIIMSLGD